ncbi:hypothetical protein EW146_g7258 [Bondarzewia mesenterica]|uniref:Uncharacterized protein n=1 Tax=Bondarzewia mesenterica TaxID=1095465 RepID=A0A4S4LLV1_9AGAM|nr:hypothetical protein EW146_g7258 [Bondarzewia mesenterica]
MTTKLNFLSPSSNSMAFFVLCDLKLYLISICNLIIKVDACYIKGMLTNPDLEPSASINRWILSILTFHFTLIHISSILHTLDGLSHCPPQPGNIAEPFNHFED